jgi:hypothetical protein
MSRKKCMLALDRRASSALNDRVRAVRIFKKHKRLKLLYSFGPYFTGFKCTLRGLLAFVRLRSMRIHDSMEGLDGS